MNFEVFGPFHVKLSADGAIDRTSEAKRKFWNDVEDKRSGLKNSRGCYAFVIMSGKTEKVWYVGKSQKQRFENEVFRPHKLKVYDRSILLVKSAPKPRIYLIANLNLQNQLLSPGGAPRAIAFVEKMLIGMAYAGNRDLMNRLDTKILRELSIPGLYKGIDDRAPSKPALALAKILEQPKKSTPRR
jgi:hypothetical protein